MFFRQLRKTSAIFLLIVLVFLVQRTVSFFSDFKEEPAQEVVDKIEKPASVICHNIVGGAAFGADSVFGKAMRLYYYSVLDDSVPDSALLEHRWFFGVDTVSVQPCERSGLVCISSISPDYLKAGSWSVDLAMGRKILDSRQFFVETEEF